MKPNEKFKTIGQFRKALLEIKENPGSEKYTKEEIAYLNNWQREFIEIMMPLQKYFQEQSKKLQGLFSKAFKNLNEQFKLSLESQRELALQSWYLPTLNVEMGFVNNISMLIGNGKIQEVNNILIDYYQKEFDRISANILEKFPNRSLPLKAAFVAHQKREYFLSIPVFFIQIEGIFEDLTGIRFFSVRRVNGKQIPKSKNFIEQLDESDFIKDFLIPIEDIRESNRSQVKGSPSGLNRHDVLHGNSNDYGTKMNSYKIFSLLAFIVNVLCHVKKQID